MTDAEHYHGLTDPLLAQHRWILLVDAAAGATPLVRHLAEVGAPRPFVLSGSPGTGETPDPELAEVAILGTGGGTVMEGFRTYFAAVTDLPGAVRDRIDAWDPDGTALAMPTGLHPAGHVHGRPIWAGRPPEWEELEDKITVDRLWDDAGIPRSPSEIVPAEPAALGEAAARLDTGAGTVWAGDNREGWHGGGEYIRLVTDEESAAEASGFLSEHCDVARVMPFLEGIPCSIHAMVFPDAERAFRPCEMLVFRTPGSGRFRYAGIATWWEPDPADRREMEDAVLKVAALLRRRVGYRGALGIDGVMTAEGFRPTELNPRSSVGLSIQGIGPDPAIPLAHLSRMLVAGEEADYRSAGLQRLVVGNAAAHPQMRSLTPLHEEQETTVSVPVRIEGAAVVEADEADAYGTLEIGPAPMGGAVVFRIDPEHAISGPSAAPIAAAAFRLADELWNAGVGPLIPADPVR